MDRNFLMTHKQSDGNIKTPMVRRIAKRYMKLHCHEVKSQ